MKLINRIIDKLQATFPPNRVMLALAGPITAASIWISAWVTAHVPGVELPVGIVAGAIGAVALITITLIYKWFDQWQKGEPINVDADVEAMIDELANAPEISAFFEAIGTFDGIAGMIAQVRARVDEGTINEAEVNEELATILAVVEGFLNDHSQEQLEQPEAVEAVGPPIPAAAVAEPEPTPPAAAPPAPPAE